MDLIRASSSEFTKLLRVSIVTSRINLDNGALVIEGTKQAEDTAKDDKFDAKMDFSCFKPKR